MVAYHEISQAYHRIFKRLGLNVSQVEADSGKIGGDTSHEFHVAVCCELDRLPDGHAQADTGEDVIMSCDHCNWPAARLAC